MPTNTTNSNLLTNYIGGPGVPAIVDGALTVNGATTLTTLASGTQTITGNETISGTLIVNGVSTLNNYLSIQKDGTSSTPQVIISSVTTPAIQLFVGIDNSANAGIQSIQQSVGYKPLNINLLGGLVTIGTLAVNTTSNLIGAVSLNSKLLYSPTAPTISSGFGTSVITAANGTAAFAVTINTGTGVSSGVISFPIAATGWIVRGSLIRAGVFTFNLVQSASTQNTATLTLVDTTTGIAANFASGDNLLCSATAW
jgi:hypothetical protein